MPKPLFGDNGSGMHCHQSIWKDGKPLFAGDGYAGLSDMALHYIGGILKHATALCAFTNPTTNSYRRLVPGYEAPVNLAYSARNRSASVRIPISAARRRPSGSSSACPDPTCNPYLAFAAMMMAGLDGIQNKIDPGKPLDKDIYALSPEELEGRAAGAGLARRGARRAREGPRLPAQGRRVHEGRHRPGSTTSARTRWIPCASARSRTSSRSTSTASQSL